KEIQHTRSHLFLVNVVMAAEAYEILYQAQLISDASESLLNKIEGEVKEKVDTLINALVVTSILSLFILMGISLLITNSIVSPISDLTNAFIDLSKGNTDSPIPIYNVNDEVGGLTKAAEAFRTKNKEMEELLLHSDALRKELSLNEERFTLALEGAKDGLWDWNIITDEVFYSNTWKNMFGYQEDEILNQLKEWKDRIHPDDMVKAMNELTQYLEGKSEVYESEMRIQCKDGSYKYILARGKAIVSDDSYITRMLGLHIDISEQKQLEQSLIESKIIADKANKAKSDFLANMSHEIRTPLNGILGLTDLVLKTSLNEKQTEYLIKSKTSSLALLRVINDILDYSKIEAGKLDLELKPFNLAEIVKNLKDLFEYQANKKGIELIFDSHLAANTMLVGDALRLTQILTNLIGNAIKFTEQGSVKVSIEVYKEKDGLKELKFSVKDSGIGISKSIQNNLFKEFSQADSSITRTYGGTGLGLAISKQLVDMMQGKIWIESVEGEGSEFIFTLSLESAPDQNQNDSALMPLELDPSHLDALKGVKILLAEDNKVNQIVAMGLLEDYLVEIDVANNGQEAVDMALKAKYDIVLMDLQMPVMDGFEATHRIREMDNYKHTPIFALSAAVMQEDKKLTQEAGMDEHLAKPIDKEILVKTLVAYSLQL
ncbi:ATP-binding protein, partial [Campylobacterota bacterium]